MQKFGEIVVFSHTFDLYEDDALNMPDALGICDVSKCFIKISRGLKPTMRRSTLLHEIIHAISDISGAGLTEKQVLALEAGLNPIVNIKSTKVDNAKTTVTHGKHA